MAKKTKETEKSTATVAAKAAARIAEETLRLNPDINEVHVTSDGTAFYTRNDAQNHANSLPNREVYSTNRRTAALKAAAAKSISVWDFLSPDRSSRRQVERSGLRMRLKRAP